MVAMLPVVAPSGSEQARKRQIALLAFYTQTVARTGRGGGVINHDLGLCSRAPVVGGFRPNVVFDFLPMNSSWAMYRARRCIWLLVGELGRPPSSLQRKL